MIFVLSMYQHISLVLEITGMVEAYLALEHDEQWFSPLFDFPACSRWFSLVFFRILRWCVLKCSWMLQLVECIGNHHGD